MTFKLPFPSEGKTEKELKKSILKGNFIRIDEIIKNIYDIELIEIVHSMLRKVLLFIISRKNIFIINIIIYYLLFIYLFIRKKTDHQ
jgi:hypothetical protein